ncbi:MAG: glycosyltransferase [Bacteroidetes bacterium]|nr:glycosyltransferase [Bacteroidota bacterium]
MKIVYLYSYNASLIGVMNKIKDVIHHLNNSGTEVIPLVICAQVPNPQDLPPGAVPLQITYVEPAWMGKGPFQLISFFRRSKHVGRLLDRELTRLNPDMVLMRYKTMNPAMGGLLRKFNFVFEHNTKEIEELEVYYHGILKSGWNKGALLWTEKYLAPRLLSKTAGIIGVTDEITQYELNRMNSQVPAITSGNGIDTSRIPFVTGPVFTGGTLHLLMLSSVSVDWQGTDKLIRSVSEHDNVKLWLVGSFSEEIKKLASTRGDKIVFTGPLTGAELDRVFQNIHLAIASLAIERKGLKEASALKVREYAARGVPVITAFPDPDLPKERMPEGYGWLQVDLKSGLIDLAQLREFALTATTTENRTKFRKYAEAYMDYAAKMKRLVVFFDKLVNSRKPLQ